MMISPHHTTGRGGEGAGICGAVWFRVWVCLGLWHHPLQTSLLELRSVSLLGLSEIVPYTVLSSRDSQKRCNYDPSGQIGASAKATYAKLHQV